MLKNDKFYDLKIEKFRKLKFTFPSDAAQGAEVIAITLGYGFCLLVYD